MSNIALSGAIKAKPHKVDPSAEVLTCELNGCDQTFTLGDSHSFVGGLATTGPLHTRPVQCPAEQHYGCCIEHALLVHFICLRDHVVPEHLNRQATATSPIVEATA